MDCIVKREFVKRILKDEADRLHKNQSLRIAQRLQFRSGHLDNSRRLVVESADNMDGKLSLHHPDYERFLDMPRQVARRKTYAQKPGRTVKYKRYGFAKKKSYQIHNAFVFGHYYSIAYRLMYDMTEDVVKSIKRDLTR